MWEKVQEALCQKKDYSGEFRNYTPGCGTVKYLAATCHHVFSTNRQLVEVIGTNVDVTECKRAEQALRESEGKFRDYAETASDWFWETGPDYKFTLADRGNRFWFTPGRSGLARRVGITLLILKRNPRSGGLSRQLSIHVNRSVTSYTAPCAVTALRCT